jgi:hypothetical protein
MQGVLILELYKINAAIQNFVVPLQQLESIKYVVETLVQIYIKCFRY